MDDALLGRILGGVSKDVTQAFLEAAPLVVVLGCTDPLDCMVVSPVTLEVDGGILGEVSRGS